MRQMVRMVRLVRMDGDGDDGEIDEEEIYHLSFAKIARVKVDNCLHDS